MILETVRPHPKRIYIIPIYLYVLKLQNYSSQCSSCVFFRKIEEHLFWVIEAVKDVITTNFFMNLSHILYVIAAAKAFYSILYSTGDNKILSGSSGPPSVKLS